MPAPSATTSSNATSPDIVRTTSAAREELGVQERESEQQFAAREEPGVQELESDQRARDPVGNVLAEIADAPVGNVTDRLLDVAADENISNVANNEDNHDVVDAPAGNVANIAEVAAVENIGNQVNQDDNHDVVNSPVIGSVPDIADINHGLLDGAAVETIT